MNGSSGIGAVQLRREEAILWAILIAALGVRLAYLYQAVDTPLFDVLLIDSEFYDRRARAIVTGDWLGDQPFFMNPFYSYFLAVIYALLGDEYWWVGLVQAALGTGSCYLIYALGRKLWSAQIGLLAAGMAAIYQPYVFYDGALLTAAPITFLNLAALYCLAHAQGAARWLLGAGLLLGLSATARPMVLLFVAAVAGWFVAQGGRRGWRRWGLVAAGCGLIVGTVACRNYLVGGEWLLTTSSAGMNFYVGNHPEANGIYAQVDFLPSAEPDLEREAFIREAETRTGREADPGSSLQILACGRLALCSGKSSRVSGATRPQTLHVLERGRGAKQPESVFGAGLCAPVELVRFGVGAGSPAGGCGLGDQPSLVPTGPVSGELFGRVPAVFHVLGISLARRASDFALRRLLDC